MRKRQALKFTHWSHFPRGPGVLHESCEDSSWRAPRRRRRLLTRPPAEATLGSAAKSGCLDAARAPQTADQLLQQLDAVDA